MKSFKFSIIDNDRVLQARTDLDLKDTPGASFLEFIGQMNKYLDANAISPQRSIKIGELMKEADIEFIDGGIIGMPAWKPGTTWLYLSGMEAETVSKCFSAGPMEIEVIGNNPGKDNYS